jgi:CPA1 family monovalent cation:H+ antiporter
MQLYDVLALLTVLAAVFGYLNNRFLRLPDTIGVMLISLIFSLGIVLPGFIKPALFKQATESFYPQKISIS